MEYLGEDIKKLGFGLMRLPRISGTEKIDIEKTKEMVDLFMDAGFTYFDTAWAYDGSEEAIKEALVDRYPRESFQLTSKAAAWMGCKTKKEAQSQLEISLKRTGAGYFDFYLLHNVGQYRTHYFDDFDMWNFVQEKKAEGLIKHVGFSCHTDPKEVDDLLNAHPEMEFIQLQINYADWDDLQLKAKECYEVARKHKKPVVIMEPVKGGYLANPPKTVADIFREAEPDQSCASWAIRFAASLDGVITVLSGMSSVDQMKDNLSYMKDFRSLNEEEKGTIQKAQKALKAFPLVPCTACNYCAKVCPNDIGISASMNMLNLNTLYGMQAAKSRIVFDFDNTGKAKPSDCAKCGACEEACPQHLKIRENLEKADELFFQ